MGHPSNLTCTQTLTQSPRPPLWQSNAGITSRPNPKRPIRCNSLVLLTIMNVSSPHRSVVVDADGKPSVRICYCICLNRRQPKFPPEDPISGRCCAFSSLSSWTDGFPTASPVTLPPCFLLMGPGEHVRSSLLHEDSLR